MYSAGSGDESNTSKGFSAISAYSAVKIILIQTLTAEAAAKECNVFGWEPYQTWQAWSLTMGCPFLQLNAF
jgi:hypothetical protein